MLLTRTYYIFGFFLIISSICVVTSNNTVFSLIFLILSFLSASIILLLLEVDFLGLVLIVIYVGAIAVLFLFAVMVVENKLAVVKQNRQSLSAPVGVVFGVLLFLPAFQSFWWNSLNGLEEHITTLIYVFDYIGVIDAYSLGGLLYSYFAVQILIVGMILLVVILGVSKIAAIRSKKTITQSAYKQLSRKTGIR